MPAIRAQRQTPILTSPACLVLTYAGASGKVDDPSELGHRIEIPGEHLIIGRGTDADLVVDLDAVSRRHARIQKQTGRYFISDLQSTNGTYVNDEPISEEPHPLNHRDEVRVGVALFRFLCSSDQATLINAYLDEVHRLAQLDALTGAMSRRQLHQTLEKEVGRARRHQRPLSLIRLDLEGLATLIHNHGALTADCILREVAARTLGHLRPDDSMARWGGGHFALLLPETDEEAAQRLSFRLGSAIAREPFVFAEEQVQVNVSLGAASLGTGSGKEVPPEPAGQPEGTALLRAAEDALGKGRRR